MRRTPIGMINTVLRTEYYSTLPWITPVLCLGLHQYSALDYTSTLPRVLRYSRLSTGVLSREYCHKDRVSVSHKDRHLWIASHRGWYLWFVYALGYALAGLFRASMVLSITYLPLGYCILCPFVCKIIGSYVILRQKKRMKIWSSTPKNLSIFTI